MFTKSPSFENKDFAISFGGNKEGLNLKQITKTAYLYYLSKGVWVRRTKNRFWLMGIRDKEAQYLADERAGLKEG
jgi:hypothetical protein